METTTKGCGSCTCGGGPKLIYSCSGAADVGELADRAARRLSAEGVGKMSCLAGIGGRVDGLTSLAKNASSILAIDGCDQQCAKKALEAAGFRGFLHLKLDELGFKKGASAPIEPGVARVVNRGKELFVEEKTCVK